MKNINKRPLKDFSKINKCQTIFTFSLPYVNDVSSSHALWQTEFSDLKTIHADLNERAIAENKKHKNGRISWHHGWLRVAVQACIDVLKA